MFPPHYGSIVLPLSNPPAPSSSSSILSSFTSGSSKTGTEDNEMNQLYSLVSTLLVNGVAGNEDTVENILEYTKMQPPAFLTQSLLAYFGIHISFAALISPLALRIVASRL